MFSSGECNYQKWRSLAHESCYKIVWWGLTVNIVYMSIQHKLHFTSIENCLAVLFEVKLERHRLSSLIPYMVIATNGSSRYLVVLEVEKISEAVM